MSQNPDFWRNGDQILEFWQVLWFFVNLATNHSVQVTRLNSRNRWFMLTRTQQLVYVMTKVEGEGVEKKFEGSSADEAIGNRTFLKAQGLLDLAWRCLQHRQVAFVEAAHAVGHSLSAFKRSRNDHVQPVLGIWIKWIAIIQELTLSPAHALLAQVLPFCSQICANEATKKPHDPF